MIGSVLRVRYEITQLLAESPVFRIFTAHDKVQSRDVSVRVLKSPFDEDEVLVQTLSDVIKRVSTVRHPVIEELYEVDSDESAIFVVGQPIKGASISDRLRKLATLSVPATVEIGISICDALQSLHRAGFAHGDIGGHSVWMQQDGEIRLQNAGIWQAFIANSQARAAILAASADYNAPEISKGGYPAPSSDVYSAGILLYELLTGRLPYHADNPVALALNHATEPTPSAKDLNPSVPKALDHIIRKAMAKSPAQRYHDGSEFLSDLRMLQDALRFGKSLTWPIQETPSAAMATGAVPDVLKEKTVARPKPEKAPRQERESDLPGWLTGLIVFVAGIVCVVVALVLFTNFKKPESVKVPELVHENFADASQALDKLGIKLLRQKTQASESAPADTILATDPDAGAIVYAGGVVKAVVSSGSRFVEVPDLRGMTPDKAKAMLVSVGLQLDDQMEQVSDKNLEAGLIVSQVQSQGGKYERGTKVKVRISSGRSRHRETSDPEANTKYVYTLRIKLTDVDKPVQLRVDMTDDQGTKTVHDANQQPGDQVDISAEGYGSKVVFRIFYDGGLVKQLPVSANKADQGDGQGDNNNPDNNQ